MKQSQKLTSHKFNDFSIYRYSKYLFIVNVLECSFLGFFNIILTIQFKAKVKFYFDLSRFKKFLIYFIYMYVVIQHWMVRFLDRGETRQSCWMEPLSLYRRNNSARCVNKFCVQIKISTTHIGFKCTCACTMYTVDGQR